MAKLKTSVKKVDVRKDEKLNISRMFQEFLVEEGYEIFNKDEIAVNLTEGSFVARGEVCDIQVALVMPKGRETRYEKVAVAVE